MLPGCFPKYDGFPLTSRGIFSNRLTLRRSLCGSASAAEDDVESDATELISCLKIPMSFESEVGVVAAA